MNIIQIILVLTIKIDKEKTNNISTDHFETKILNTNLSIIPLRFLNKTEKHGFQRTLIFVIHLMYARYWQDCSASFPNNKIVNTIKCPRLFICHKIL